VPRTHDPEAALAHLRAADSVMAHLAGLHGPPVLEPRATDPFTALTRAIVFQQLSGRAATAILARLESLLGALPPVEQAATLLSASDEALRAAGLSRQKTASLRDLAARYLGGWLGAGNLDEWEDGEVIGHLTQVRGVGRWTAEMYLIFNLRRADVLPVNDLGLNRAIMQLYGLAGMPKSADVESVARAWRPWATAACLYLWRSQDVVLPPAASGTGGP
jgi:DNA-3-methyladenine glycosylase II